MFLSLQGLISGAYSFDLVLLNTTERITVVGNYTEIIILYRPAEMLLANSQITDPSIGDEEIDISVLKWNSTTRSWTDACPACTSSAEVDKGNLTFTGYLDEVQTPLQLAMFFNYSDQYGVFGMADAHTCVSLSNSNTTGVHFLRRRGAYSSVNVTWKAESVKGFHSSGLLHQGSLLIKEGQWNSSVSVTVPEPQGKVGYVSVSLESTGSVGRIDRNAVSLIVLRNAVPSGIVEFANSRIVTREGSNQLAIAVVRRCGSSSPLRVSFNLSYQDSTGGVLLNASLNTSDYDVLPSEIHFSAGQETTYLYVDIKNDTIPELDETLTISIVEAGDILVGPLSSINITIQSNDDPHGVFELSTDSVVVREGAVNVTSLTVIRRRGLFGSVQVKWSAAAVSATGLNNTQNMTDTELLQLIRAIETGQDTRPIDFIPESSSITFTNDQQRADLRVYIVNDSIPELNESFSVALTSVDGNARLGKPVMATITIEPKNDHVPVFSTTAVTVILLQEDVVSSPGVKVLTVNASDPDLGESGQITYSLVSSHTNCSWLHVNARTGLLYNAEPLMPWNASLNCVAAIKASDHGVPAYSSEISVSISINFTNRCRPGSFSQSGFLNCTLCNISTYQNEFGQVSCVPCPNQKRTVGLGASNSSLCLGMYSLFWEK